MRKRAVNAERELLLVELQELLLALAQLLTGQWARPLAEQARLPACRLALL